MSLLSIFLAFVKIGSMCFGGAYAAIPIVEREVVYVKQWMTIAEFSDLVAIDEITPGPIIVNSASFVGMRLAGIPGAIVASLGCVVVPIIVTITLIYVYRKFRDIKAINEAIYTLKCMTVALIVSTWLSIFLNAVFPGKVIAMDNIDYLLLTMGIAAFLVIKKYKPNPLYVMLACGAINLVIRGFLKL